MEKSIKPADLQEINRYHQYDVCIKTIKEYLTWANFKVNDVLIQRDKELNDEVVLISSKCPVPKKYKIIFIDDCQIPWVKRVSVRGGLGKKVKPLTDLAPYRYCFEIDPEKFTAELLNYRYDSRIEYKRMRDDNENYGKD